MCISGPQQIRTSNLKHFIILNVLVPNMHTTSQLLVMFYLGTSSPKKKVNLVTLSLKEGEGVRFSHKPVEKVNKICKHYLNLHKSNVIDISRVK